MDNEWGFDDAPRPTDAQVQEDLGKVVGLGEKKRHRRQTTIAAAGTLAVAVVVLGIASVTNGHNTQTATTATLNTTPAPTTSTTIPITTEESLTFVAKFYTEYQAHFDRSDADPNYDRDGQLLDAYIKDNVTTDFYTKITDEKNQGAGSYDLLECAQDDAPGEQLGADKVGDTVIVHRRENYSSQTNDFDVHVVKQGSVLKISQVVCD